jgi:hypothetical protein
MDTGKYFFGGQYMEKVIKLCKAGSCCPEVRISNNQVKIGEKDNICVLTTSEWELLKEKILNREV